MRNLRHVAVILLASASFMVSADATLDSARRHIENGKPQLAWELLAPLNDARAGDVEFDYLLGLAALDTGRRTEAIFAFERVLAIQSDHAQARAELARAHFELNELNRAQQQFEQVLADDSVPQAARAQIGRYLSAIEEIESDVDTAWSAHISLALGHDDNVNTGPSSSQIAVPALGGAIVILDDSSLPEESAFVLTRLRGNLVHKFSDGMHLLAGAGFSQRDNSESDAESFDTRTIDYNIGLRMLSSEFNHFTLSLQGQDFDLDGEAYRDVLGILGQWRNRISSNREISVYGKFSEIEFDDQSARDAERSVIGGGFSQFFPGKRNPVLYIGIYSGTEETDDSDSDHLGYEFIGLRVGGQTKLGDRNILFASITWENREYDDTDPFFLTTREDDYLSATIGLRYRYNEQFSLAPEVFWSENDSNIDINENDKTSATLTARFEF